MADVNEDYERGRREGVEAFAREIDHLNRQSATIPLGQHADYAKTWLRDDYEERNFPGLRYGNRRPRRKRKGAG